MAEKVPVLIRGNHYESMAEAARQIGCSFLSVRNAINNGRPDSAGKGRNWDRKKPVLINGTLYESIADGARSINADTESVRSAVRRIKKSGRPYVFFKGHKVEVLK